jgi:predicted DNA-binding transcriptional regulator AlpA
MTSNTNQKEVNDFESPFLRMEQIMAILHCSRSTVHKYQAQRGFPKGSRISGRLTLYPKKDVMAWIENEMALTAVK